MGYEWDIFGKKGFNGNMMEFNIYDILGISWDIHGNIGY